MGIPAYFINLLKSHPNLLSRFKSTTNIDALYFDANSIIYDVLREMEKKNSHSIKTSELCEGVCNKLNDYITSLNPQHTIFISFDGVAPAAKMEQQRQRRYKSAILRDVKLCDNPNYIGGFDTNQITPFTPFMNELCIVVKKYFNSKTYKSRNGVPVKIVLNLSDEFGEGEHKIFTYIRNHDALLREATRNPKYSHFVYGLDSDLIMLCLINSDKVSNICLLRETPEFIKNVNSSYEPNQLYYLNFNKHANVITQGIHENDYVFVSFLLGNDFIAHNPCFSLRRQGLEVVLATYKKVFKCNQQGSAHLICVDGEPLNNNTEKKRVINWHNVARLFTALAGLEKNAMGDAIQRKQDCVAKTAFRSTKGMSLDEKLAMLPKTHLTSETHIDITTPLWREQYYKFIMEMNVRENPKELEHLCINYLESLEWSFYYYSQQPLSYFWKYDYSYAPLLSDVITYLDAFSQRAQPTHLKLYDEDMHPQTQLCYVLPYESYGFCDARAASYVETAFPSVIHHTRKYKYAFCDYLWEGHLDLNRVDLRELNERISFIVSM